jgi:predicted GIY-YIG superfamily endonuclease
MWPRALFHSKEGKEFLEKNLKEPGVYVLYRSDQPYYIGKTDKTLFRRLKTHALRPNTKRYNLWDYFCAFEIPDASDRVTIEAILISAMPTANSSRPKIERIKLDRDAARLVNNVQALILTGKDDSSGEGSPESTEGEEESES